MAGITLAQAEAKLSSWMDAEDAVATGQSYSIAGRSLSRADLGQIGERIDFWQKKVTKLTRGGIGIKGGTPT